MGDLDKSIATHGRSSPGKVGRMVRNRKEFAFGELDTRAFQPLNVHHNPVVTVKPEARIRVNL